MINLAGCIVLDESERMLLIHRATPRRSEWEIPGGKVERGETAAQAAVRELSEELGILVAVQRSLGVAPFVSSAGSFTYEWFLSTIEQGTPTIREPQKFDRWRFVAFGELRSIGSLSINVENFLRVYSTTEQLYEYH